MQLIAQFGLDESYPPRILHIKARNLRRLMGNDKHQTQWESEYRTLSSLLKVNMTRPWKMIATHPIVQVLAFYQAASLGTVYLLISGFPALYEDRYYFSKGEASLHYIALALGSIVGVTCCGPATDATYAYLKKRYGIAAEEPGRPEFRVPLMLPAAIISPLGILLFAWSAEMKLHFLLPDVHPTHLNQW
jgi:hypothetical protein